MNNAEYNGWSNYETWSVNLWINNDQDSLNYWNKVTEFCYSAKQNPEGSYIEAVYKLSDYLREQFNEGTPITEGLYGQLLGGALSVVDWREIAEHFCDDYETELAIKSRKELTA